MDFVVEPSPEFQVPAARNRLQPPSALVPPCPAKHAPSRRRVELHRPSPPSRRPPDLPGCLPPLHPVAPRTRQAPLHQAPPSPRRIERWCSSASSRVDRAPAWPDRQRLPARSPARPLAWYAPSLPPSPLLKLMRSERSRRAAVWCGTGQRPCALLKDLFHHSSFVVPFSCFR
ncbi:hypothetical protein ACQJBY_003044 [Aegilops geniculata]